MKTIEEYKEDLDKIIQELQQLEQRKAFLTNEGVGLQRVIKELTPKPEIKKKDA